MPALDVLRALLRARADDEAVPYVVELDVHLPDDTPATLKAARDAVAGAFGGEVVGGAGGAAFGNGSNRTGVFWKFKVKMNMKFKTRAAQIAKAFDVLSTPKGGRRAVDVMGFAAWPADAEKLKPGTDARAIAERVPTMSAEEAGRILKKIGEEEAAAACKSARDASALAQLNQQIADLRSQLEARGAELAKARAGAPSAAARGGASTAPIVGPRTAAAAAVAPTEAAAAEGDATAPTGGTGVAAPPGPGEAIAAAVSGGEGATVTAVEASDESAASPAAAEISLPTLRP
jgi:hypothetical protein